MFRWSPSILKWQTSHLLHTDRRVRSNTINQLNNFIGQKNDSNFSLMNISVYAVFKWEWKRTCGNLSPHTSQSLWLRLAPLNHRLVLPNCWHTEISTYFLSLTVMQPIYPFEFKYISFMPSLRFKLWFTRIKATMLPLHYTSLTGIPLIYFPQWFSMVTVVSSDEFFCMNGTMR